MRRCLALAGTFVGGGEEAPELLKRFRRLFGFALFAWFGVALFQQDLWFATDAFFSAATQRAFAPNDFANLLLWPLGDWAVTQATVLYPALGVLGCLLSLRLAHAKRPWISAILLVGLLTLFISRMGILIYGGDGLFIAVLWILAGALACPQCPRDAKIFVFLIRFQFSFLYVSTALWKAANPAWWDGTAIQNALLLQNYSRFPEVAATLGPIALKWVGIIACLSELGLGILPWIPRLAFPVFLLGLGMHLIFDYMFMIIVWQWMMISGLAIFVPQRFWPHRLTLT